MSTTRTHPGPDRLRLQYRFSPVPTPGRIVYVGVHPKLFLTRNFEVSPLSFFLKKFEVSPLEVLEVLSDEEL